MKNEKMITISESEYENLIKSKKILNVLLDSLIDFEDAIKERRKIQQEKFKKQSVLNEPDYPYTAELSLISNWQSALNMIEKNFKEKLQKGK